MLFTPLKLGALALPARITSGAPLNTPDANTFCTPGAKGYTGYPTLKIESVSTPV